MTMSSKVDEIVSLLDRCSHGYGSQLAPWDGQTEKSTCDKGSSLNSNAYRWRDVFEVDLKGRPTESLRILRYEKYPDIPGLDFEKDLHDVKAVVSHWLTSGSCRGLTVKEPTSSVHFQLLSYLLKAVGTLELWKSIRVCLEDIMDTKPAFEWSDENVGSRKKKISIATMVDMLEAWEDKTTDILHELRETARSHSIIFRALDHKTKRWATTVYLGGDDDIIETGILSISSGEDTSNANGNHHAPPSVRTDEDCDRSLRLVSSMSRHRYHSNSSQPLFATVPLIPGLTATTSVCMHSG